MLAVQEPLIGVDLVFKEPPSLFCFVLIGSLLEASKGIIYSTQLSFHSYVNQLHVVKSRLLPPRHLLQILHQDKPRAQHRIRLFQSRLVDQC